MLIDYIGVTGVVASCEDRGTVGYPINKARKHEQHALLHCSQPNTMRRVCSSRRYTRLEDLSFSTSRLHTWQTPSPRS